MGEIIDEYEPLEEGLDNVTETRNLPCLEIKLSKDPLDTSDKGYQAPLDESEVKEYDPDEKISRPRGPKKGKGKGKGKGKESSDGAKGKGAGKGKGKSAEEPAKGKDKGKGKSKDAGKGKDKGKDK